MLRTADAAGADAVVLTDASVDPYNGKCVRASAGSLFHLPVVGRPAGRRRRTRLRAPACRCWPPTGWGATTSTTLADAGGLAGPTAWLFGNEAWGLPDEASRTGRPVVRVPIHGRAESLNLAAAAAVCLYASARAQRRAPGTQPWWVRPLDRRGGIRRRRDKAAYDGLPDGVVVVADGAGPSSFNRRSGGCTGVDPDAALGHPLAEVLPLEDARGRDWWACTEPYAGLAIRTGQPESSAAGCPVAKAATCSSPRPTCATTARSPG